MPHPLCPQSCGANAMYRTNLRGEVVLIQCIHHGTTVLPGGDYYLQGKGDGTDAGGGSGSVCCNICSATIKKRGRNHIYCHECAKEENIRKTAERQYQRYHGEK